MLITYRTTVIWMLSTLSVSAALGSEYSAGVAVPAPVGHIQDGLAIDNVSIHVRNLDVAIRYTLANNNKKPVSTDLTIYGPLFGWEGVDSRYPDKAFLELQVTVNQEAVKVQRNVIALHHGQLVNDKLTRLHLDPLWMARNPDKPIETSSVPKAKLRAATRDGLIKDFGQGMTPDWYALATHSWHTTVPAQSQRQLTLSYQLRPGFEPFQLNDTKLSKLLNEHCASSEQLKEQIKTLGRTAPEAVVALRYTVPIGLANGRLPQSVSVELTQESAWAGLHPLLSFTCKTNGSAAIGSPAFSQEVSTPIGQPLSILVILPQE